MKFSAQSRHLFYQVIYDLFVLSFVFYLIILWIDRAQKEYISYYFDPNFILALVVLSGIITVIHNTECRRKNKKRES